MVIFPCYHNIEISRLNAELSMFLNSKLIKIFPLKIVSKCFCNFVFCCIIYFFCPSQTDALTGEYCKSKNNKPDQLYLISCCETDIRDPLKDHHCTTTVYPLPHQIHIAVNIIFLLVRIMRSVIQWHMKINSVCWNEAANKSEQAAQKSNDFRTP